MTTGLKHSPWTRCWLLGLILVGATICAYQPAWHAGFIWDDDRYVTNNPLLTAPDGLQRIWFSTDSPSQYFPLVYTTFRFEHALWGLNPVGYHWVNLLLHAVNALLVWRLLQRLAVPGAWLAAAIFALHPVNVESVAWVTELKNVQSLFFILLALLAWVRFLASEESRELRAESLEHKLSGKSEGSTLSSQLPALSFSRPWAWYALALFFYLLALFSKTTACTLPAALLLILWLKRKPIGWARLAQIVPFLGLGFAMGLLTMWWERHHQGTARDVFALGLVERGLVASRAAWFYLGKLVWPTDLIFIYPSWKIDRAAPFAYLWLVAGAALGAAIYFARRFVGRGVETATVYYLATLAPMLGFVMLYTFQYKFVADHYQYVASLGPIALAAAGLTLFARKATKNPWLKPVLSGALLTTLAVLTWRQCGMYSDLETLWRTTLAKNPDTFLVLNNLGEVLLETKRPAEAIGYFQQTLKIKPDSAKAHCNYGVALLHTGNAAEAIREFQAALVIQPDLAEAHKNLSDVFIEQGRLDEALAYSWKAVAINPGFAEAQNNLGNVLLQMEQLDEAIVHLETALKIRPDFPNALNNLGVAMVQKGKPQEAAVLFERTLAILPGFAQAHHNLGRLELMKGNAREAIAHYVTALQIQPGDPESLSSLAWVLATSPDATLRDGPRAIELAQQANELSGGQSAAVLGTLAAAYAEGGRFGDASAAAQRALRLAEAQANPAFAAMLRSQLKLHQAGAPFRDHGVTETSPNSSRE
jgi:tetratricopeptide (TPR) repeat protein